MVVRDCYCHRAFSYRGCYACTMMKRSEQPRAHPIHVLLLNALGKNEKRHTSFKTIYTWAVAVAVLCCALICTENVQPDKRISMGDKRFRAN